MSLARRSAIAIACILATSAHGQEAKPAQPDVAAANQAVLAQLPFGDRQDFEDANRGFIATVPANPDRYAFLKGEPPPTVNPSLWREAQLDAINGLFKVTDGVYQVRGLSVAAMTIVEGQTGIIVIDTLASPGEAKTALDLYFAHRPKRPVVAIIYSHDHGDHYGGASAVIAPADAASGKVKVIAPAGFMPAVTEEASVAANLGGARGQFQFGGGLPVGARGTVDYGEGETVSSGPAGAGPIVPPNDIIKKPFETRIIDGVNFEFQLALDTEAPSEMFVYLPKAHVLDMGEDDSHTLHNLLPIRGTLVRNGFNWSQALNTALDHFGGEVQILINQHQWPVWGNARVRASLADHRDLYKYIHDQTLRMMNQGMAPREIANAITMPPGLEADWSLRGYYGALPQDVMAVYQRYTGWYDGNPANLNRLPPVEEAKKYLEYMGGPNAAIAKAREDFKAGNYRWVAEVMDQLVFADPSNKEARALAADAFEQMGYASENAPWRNSYLLAAQKLRSDTSTAQRPGPAITPQVLRVMPAGEMFDYLGTRIDGPRAGAAKIVINWRFTDTHETLVSTLEHGALTWSSGEADPHADATVMTTRQILEPVILGQKTLADAMGHGMAATGNASAVSDLWALLVDFKSGIALVEPN
ncbi:MAG TPA: alkyl sulfatase dimerization domain-containing protein [Rhizomicrobium sp.]|jgi:alkyl sulfatase BDS1-like metallo-beta-lactamase superfamily hydrolase|nr:alkyl sulfatase dimerization domain-containing protein [Rhizomicrobium sp.]